MPPIPEEPQIYESVPGPRVAPAAGRPASTPRPVPGPGPRPVVPRPAPPRGAPAANARPGRPGPARGAAATPQQRPPRDSEAAAAPAAAQIQLIPAPADGALDAAEETVDLLLDTGRAPGEILVLTTGEKHAWAAHELSFGEASYWAQYDAGDDVFYAAIDAERPTSRPVVIVAVNGDGDEGTALLPTALARAGALLIVCGDPQRINGMLGASV
jgi:hypothetical protein